MKGIAWLAVLSIGLSFAAFAEGLGRWTTGSPMPSARSEVAVAAVGFVKLTDYRPFSAFLHEAKPLILHIAAICDLSRFRSESG